MKPLNDSVQPSDEHGDRAVGGGDFVPESGGDRGGPSLEGPGSGGSNVSTQRVRVSGLPERFSSWLLRHRSPLAILGVIILAIAWPLSARLKMDRTIDQMFDRDDPTLVAYDELRHSFGGNAVVMLVYRDAELFTPGGLTRAAELSRRVEAIAGVRGVLSVAELNEVLGLIRPAGFLSRAGGGDSYPLLREDDIVVRAFEKLFTGYTHSEDDDVASVVALLDEPDDDLGHAAVIRSLESVTRQMPEGATDAVLVGEPVLLDQGFDLIQRDGDRLAWLTIALLSPCVLFLLRSPRFVLLQVVVILWAVTTTRATLYLLGFELSLVSSILTAIVTVIAVTAVIHLGSNQRMFRKRGYAAKPAALRSFAWVMPPIFWACATDAAGFVSLSVSGIAPVREFGWMMAIASLAVWLGIVLFSPLLVTSGASRFRAAEQLLSWIEPKAIDRLERLLRKFSLRSAVLLVRYRRIAMVTTVCLAVLTWVGVSRLEIESSFLRNFRADSDLVKAYQMVESELSGAGVWDVVLDAPDDLSSGYMAQVRELEQRLRAIEVDGEKLTKVLSLADADRIASAVPLLRFASPTIRLAGMRSAIPAFSDALLMPRQTDDGGESAERRKLRIMLRSREHLTTETKISLIQEVERVVAEHTTGAEWLAEFGAGDQPSPGRVTGYYVMLARVVSQLIRDQWVCLGVSAMLVWVLLIGATRSLRLATIAMVPNVLPVFAVLAALGLSGTKMNMGAAMIAAVSIGLSIDGSVHFMSSYRRKIRRFRGRFHAVLFAQKQIGLPLMMATVALTIGFSVLAISEFIPTATFGLLTAAALVAGTITNLTLLPAMLGGRLPRNPR